MGLYLIGCPFVSASAIVVLLFFFFFVGTDHYHSLPQPDLLAEEIVTPPKQWPTNGSSLAVKAFCKIARLIIRLVDDTSPLPLDYSSKNNPKPQCEDTYGLTYLFHLRDSRASYCSAHSASALHCYRARIQETREDSFCLAMISSTLVRVARLPEGRRPKTCTSD
jgi:hypothetical protein